MEEVFDHQILYFDPFKYYSYFIVIQMGYIRIKNENTRHSCDFNISRNK